MKIKRAFFSLICLLLCAVAFVPSSLSLVRADTTKCTVKLDYNMSDISDKFSSDTRSIKDYTYLVDCGECVSHVLDSEDNKNLNTIRDAYEEPTWMVGNSEVDISKYKIYKDTTFVAKWTPKEFTISFNCGGTEDYPVNQEIADFKFTIKTLSNDYNVSYRFKPERKGYLFDGWYKSPSYSQSSKILWIGLADLGSYTLYAKWVPNEYRINYVTSGENTKNPTSYNVEEGKIELYEPVLEGHIFKGWYMDEKLTVPVEEIDCSWARNMSIYPKWELETYKVTYILPDGTRAQVDCEYGKTASLPTELKKSIFEVVKTDVSRDNIKGDTRIIVSLVNIWWVYAIAMGVVLLIVLLVILIKRKRRREFRRLRKTYQSNASKYSKRPKKTLGYKTSKKN